VTGLLVLELVKLVLVRLFVLVNAPLRVAALKIGKSAGQARNAMATCARGHRSSGAQRRTDQG